MTEGISPDALALGTLIGQINLISALPDEQIEQLGKEVGVETDPLKVAIHIEYADGLRVRPFAAKLLIAMKLHSAIFDNSVIN